MTTCVHLYHLGAPVPWEDVRPPGIDGCQPPCRCWDLNPSSQEKQPLLLTTEASLPKLPDLVDESPSLGPRALQLG